MHRFSVCLIPVLAMFCLLAVWPVLATIEVDITSYTPSDGNLDDETVNTMTIEWEIEVDEGESGDFRVEIDGDGSPESGELIEDEDGDGSFSGNKTGSSTITVKDDLNDGDGDYVVYVIAVDEDDEENYGFDSVTITLDNPPEVPDGLSLGVGDEKLFITWDKNEDRDIDTYYLYYDTEPGETADDYNGTDSSDGDSPISMGDTDNYTLNGLENDTTYYFRISAKDDSDTESDLSDEESATPAQVNGLAELVNEEGGCFVATAAFGDYDAPEVRILRNLRDEVLLKSEAGQALVELYYRTSPPLAAMIADSSTLRWSARCALAPLVTGSALYLAAPPSVRGWLPLAAAAVLAIFLLQLLRRSAIRVFMKRSTRSPRLRMLLPLLLVLCLVSANNASAAEEEYQQSPIHFSCNVHVGFLFPDIEEFEDVYDKEWMATYGLEFGYKMVRDFEIVGEISYGFADGDGVTRGGTSTDEEYRLHVAPASLSLLYRLKFLENQPVVPYLGAGVSYVYFHEHRLEETDIETHGGNWGYQGFGGVQILLDLIDKRASSHMDIDFGINNTYLYYEFRYQALNDFKFDDDEDGLDLTSMVHTAGLLFEF